MVFLIPKRNIQFRGIRLVEVIWKAVLAVVNFRKGAMVNFHDMLHGFRSGIGTGTASTEVNLLQNLVEMREEVLYEVFLDLKKSYDALDRERCMDIMVSYGIGPCTDRILSLYWDYLLVVSRARQYYGALLQGSHRVTQGDPLSLII